MRRALSGASCRLRRSPKPTNVLNPRGSLDALLSEKAYVRQSRLSWLREPPSRVAGRSLIELLDKLDLLRTTGVPALALPDAYRPRLAQMARGGVRYTAQAFQQMGPAQRHSVMVATLRELEATLTDAALAMFRSLVGRAHLRAKKRVEEAVTVSADQGRERLARIADLLDALVKAARKGGDVAGAVTAVAALDTIEAYAALIRRPRARAAPTCSDSLRLTPITGAISSRTSFALSKRSAESRRVTTRLT